MANRTYVKSIREINDTLYSEYFETRERVKNDTYTLDNNVSIKTGLIQLDSIIGPISLDSLYLIGSRPAMGKTSLMIDMALNMAKYKPVYIFSLEMYADHLAKRILSKISDIDFIALDKKPLKNDETEKIKQGIKTLDKLPIYICDKAPITLKELIELAEARDGIVFIDYLQLVAKNKRGKTGTAIVQFDNKTGNFFE